MGDLTNQAIINAPPEAVFDFVGNPHNAPRYISSITAIVSGPDGAPAVGQTWQAEANFLGRQSNIVLRLQDLRPPNLVRFTIEGEPQAALSLYITPEGNGTQTNVALTLDVPSVPSVFLNAFMNNILTMDIARLKSILESQA